MNWLAVYRSDRASVALRQAVLSKDDVVACESAVAMLQHLEARQQAQELAHAQALEAARQAGFEQGRTEAMALVQGPLMAQWAQVATQARSDLCQLREAAVNLSVQIVQRMASELAPEDVLLALARQAVAEQGLGQARAAVVLHVHPDWADLLCAHIEVAPLSDVVQVEVRPDPACALMDLVIETPLGQILAGLQAQLGRIEHNLKEALA